MKSVAGIAAAEQLAYRRRTQVQLLAWAQGRPYHNRIDDECCPDFSCCITGMYERDPAKRWEIYRQFLLRVV
jgi:hypothetical protein